MLLEIATPEGKVFEWKIEKMIIPTQVGEICILKNHQPLVSIVDPGIVKIKLHTKQKNEFIKWTSFLFEDDWLCISVWSGIVYVSWTEIVILSSTATVSIETDEEILEKMKKDMEKQIQEIKTKWSFDDIEKAFLNLQKITADLKLHKIKRKS